MIMRSVPIAKYVLAVSRIVSPFVKEEFPGVKLRVSADKRLAASSKLLRVRVDGSKNRLATTCPCKVGTFLVRRDKTSRKLAAVCRTVSYSAGIKSNKEMT